jgi:peptide/nickel transport system ATP-binding protein
MASLLEIKNLTVEFQSKKKPIPALKKISFSIEKGETVAVVGESGSGKSVTALTVMGLLSDNAVISTGEVLFNGQDLLKKTESEMRALRGDRISMIFQEPMTSLNPVMTLGDQVAEVLLIHGKCNRSNVRAKVIDLFRQVEIPHPEERYKSYPHEISGGQQQRVMIAMALACKPDLLIADEPTTALDVTIQKTILELLRNLKNDFNMGLMFITHDLGIVADIADRVVVIYRGDIVEVGPTKAIFEAPKHPYTKGLLSCRPPMHFKPKRLATVSDFMSEDGQQLVPNNPDFTTPRVNHQASNEIILQTVDLCKYYPLKKTFLGKPTSFVKAVDQINITVRRGQTLGLVGESGCGKTSLGRTIIKLQPATSGTIQFLGQDITNMSEGEVRPLRKKMQYIFQNPYASLNPRMTIGNSLIEPYKIHGIGDSREDRVERAVALLRRVGLDDYALSRYPHEFSGGQRQRICIARALALEPEMIICDECVSALDASVQAQILNLLLDLQEERGLTYIFISHDLSVVKFFSDQVGVMYAGKIVEYGDSEEIYENPQHDFTKKLLNAIPGTKLG